MKVFNLEYQYQEYLRLVKLDENKMGDTQRVETKRAWYGACGQILMLMQADLTQLDEDKAVEMLQNMTDQVENFFQKELNRQN